MIYVVHKLPWSAVDPTRVTRDPAEARPIARRLLAILRAGELLHARFNLYEGALDLALVAHFGLWAVGWDWNASSGGPVNAPLAPARRDDLDARAEHAVARVTRWRDFLCEVADLQGALRDETAALPLEDRIERAATRYLPFVLDHTDAEDAWYGTFSVLMRWHVEALGFDDPRVAAAVDKLVSGSFESWTAPSDEAAAELAASLGRRLAGTCAGGADPADALALWWVTRARTRWGVDWPHAPVPFEADGHRAFIALHDSARSPDRAQRMGEALAYVRAEARARRPLTWDLLREAQARVLGATAGFRTGDAFAHGGRERYALHADTFARFARCLAEANDPSLHPTARAARVYLDVCFVHPFVDGNARAARLALDHVLTSAGLALRTVEPAFLLPRRADDPLVGTNLAHLLSQVAGPAV